MKIILDHAQYRFTNDRTHVVFSGEQLDQGTYSNTYREKVNGFIMLLPSRYESSWYNSNSGNYAKIALGSLTINSGVFEQTFIGSVATGPWIGNGTNLGGEVRTNDSYSKNRGIVLSCFNYGGQESQSVDPLINVGWGTSKSTSQIYFSIYPDGKVDMYRAGISSVFYSGSISAFTPQTGKQQQGKNTDSFFDLLFLPYNHNQILVESLNGGSYVIELDYILQSDTNPTLTPAGNFFVNVPSTRTAKFQIAPVVFNTSGTILSEPMNFVDPPPSGATLDIFGNDSWIGIQSYKVYGSSAYVGTQSASVEPKNWAGSSFTANGINSQVKALVTLTSSDSGYTPTLVGGQLAYTGLTTTTSNSEQDITAYCATCTLDVPENPLDTRVEFKIPNIVLNTGGVLGLCTTSGGPVVANITTQLNRPVKILDDNDVEIFNGLITNLSLTHYNNHYELDVQCGSRAALLDQYIFRERVPLSNEFLSSVILFIEDKATPTNYSITNLGSKLPYVSSSDPDDWGPIINVGDTGSGSLSQIFSTYAPDWVWGWKYNDTFFASPKSIYGSTHQGIASQTSQAIALGYSSSHGNVYYSLHQDVIAPEANEIRVTGRNPRDRTLFQVWKEDTASKAVTTPPASRPSNWAGCQKFYGTIDPAITSIGIASTCCNLLFDRLTKTRFLYEVDTKYLTIGTAPVWTGDRIPIYGIGTCQVVAFKINWIKSDITQASYTTELIQ